MSPGIYTCELAARTGSLGRTLALSLSLLATAKHNNLDSTDISVDARDVTESIWLRVTCLGQRECSAPTTSPDSRTLNGSKNVATRREPATCDSLYDRPVALQATLSELPHWPRPAPPRLASPRHGVSVEARRHGPRGAHRPSRSTRQGAYGTVRRAWPIPLYALADVKIRYDPSHDWAHGGSTIRRVGYPTIRRSEGPTIGRSVGTSALVTDAMDR